MRTTVGSALFLIIAGALAAPAPAATLDAPGSVAPAEQVAVTASGLTPGVRYAVFLSRDRREKGMQQKLAGELMDAINGQGGAFKKKDDIYRMAQANKAFAHYRW